MFIFGVVLMIQGLILFILGTTYADSLPTYGWLDPYTMVSVGTIILGLFVLVLGGYILSERTKNNDIK